nr:plasmid mobilization relaxosome protein MobC [Pedobacter panaciterrae]
MENKKKHLAGRPVMNSGQRIKKIDTRFTVEEFNMILDLEKTLGIRRTDLIRIRVLENSMGLVVNAKEVISRLDVLGADLGRIGNNMNQLAKYANTLNKRGVLSPQIIERYNMLLEDYLRIQKRLDAALRKVIRSMVS